MVRALEKYFGVTPDLDIEEQRAILSIKRPLAIDWRAVGELVRRANYTFGGAHLRARGRVFEDDAGSKKVVFEFEGSGQRVEIKNHRNVLPFIGRVSELVVRVEDWNWHQARLVILNSP